jgi:hypothetical protein
MAVTSASTTVVSCADTRSDSTIRCAITWRGLDIRWVVPRSEDGATAGRAAGAAGGAAGDDGPSGIRWACWGTTAAGASWGACGACGAGACDPRWARAASMTSCLRIRPPTPVPVTVSRFTECSAASLRTRGVTYGASPAPGSGVGGGYSSSSADEPDDGASAAWAGALGGAGWVSASALADGAWAAGCP